MPKMFDAEEFIAESIESLKATIDDIAIIACSGGVDSTVCLLYTSPSPRDATLSRMPSSA